MINIYIATFHSHYGAIKYCKNLNKNKIHAKAMPVPRTVSSSCGTCILYEAEDIIIIDNCELDSIYIKEENDFELVYEDKG